MAQTALDDAYSALDRVDCSDSDCNDATERRHRCRPGRGL
jgi:hypothetical protein